MRRPKGSSPSIAQLASSIVAEANLKRLGSSLTKLGSEAAVGVVDTKRLELAIAGSGARIKVSPLLLKSTLSSPVQLHRGTTKKECGMWVVGYDCLEGQLAHSNVVVLL